MPKAVFVRNLSYENVFRLQVLFHANQSFSYERFCSWTCFETEAKGDLEPAYYCGAQCSRKLSVINGSWRPRLRPTMAWWPGEEPKALLPKTDCMRLKFILFNGRNSIIGRFSEAGRKLIGFAFTTLHDWLIKLAPLFHPIRSNTTRDYLVHVYPGFTSAASSFDWFILLSVSSMIG